MQEEFLRTGLVLGEAAMDRLSCAHIAVFGLGGVGGYAADAIARSGVSKMTIVDNDSYTPSNINRQLSALHSTLGASKTAVTAARLRDINPQLSVYARECFFSEETASDFDFEDFDYVIDAIDTVTSKLLLAELCEKAKTPLISCMGTGNKTDAAAFRVADIYETSVCPLARVMRRELKKRGIPALKVVYSEEEPAKVLAEPDGSGRRAVPGSVPFVPPVAGFILAGEVIKDLTKESFFNNAH